MEFTIPQHITDEFTERIERGIAFLDNYFGTKEWVNEIDLDRLDLNDCTTCVCGQLFSPDGNKIFAGQSMEADGYHYVLKHVIEHEDNYQEYAASWAASKHGFNLWTDQEDSDDLDEIIAKHNSLSYGAAVGTPGFPTAWGLLNDMWVERLEKRKAEMGAMA